MREPRRDRDDLGGGFRRVGEETVFRGHLFSVAHLRLVDPGGEAFERDVVVHPGAVAVVPLHDDGSVTLVRQLRPAVGAAVLEVPAGTCDVDGEPTVETARRELAEEAGLEAAAFRPLATVLNSPGYTSQRTIVYLATGLSSCPTARAGVEERHMTVERVPLGDVEGLVAAGALVDATTVVGLLLARSRVQRPPARPA